METYTKILGIITTVALLICIVAILIEVIEYDEYTLLLLFLPIYSAIHYLIATRFGFKAIQRINLFLTFSIIIMITSIVIPGIDMYQNYSDEKKKEADRIKYHEELENYKDPRIFSDITTYNIKCNLKLRIDEFAVDYIFQADGLPKGKEIDEFIIKFLDKEGFQIRENNINNLTRSIDKYGNVSGYSSLGRFIGFSLETFINTESIEVATRKY